MTKPNPDAAPLVSVICRSINRSQLNEALASVSRQAYTNIEVILVDATGTGNINYQDHSPDLSIKLISTGEPLPRSAAANIGLANSSGDYLMFLDDDDWIGEKHIVDLFTALQNQSSCQAAYSNTQKTTEDGRLLDEVFAQEFDPVLLRRDNYIPIHAMLFQSSLLNHGCQFDASLDIYEDWDFWLQLSRHTDFLHVDKISAYYRLGGESETAIEDNHLRYDGLHKTALARDAIYDKWKGIWSGKELNQLLGSLDQTEMISEANKTAAGFHDQLVDSREQLAKTHRQLNDLQLERDQIQNKYNLSQHELEQSLKSIEESKKYIEQLQTSNEQLHQNIAQTQSQLAESQHWAEDLHQRLENRIREVEVIKNHLRETQNTVDALYNSFSWKAMGPYRRGKRLLFQGLLNPAKTRLAKMLNKPMPVTADSVATESKQSGALVNEAQSAEDLKASYKQNAQSHLEEFLKKQQPLTFPREAQPTVSIILVLYNQCALTLLCLESILENVNCSYQLVIVDNASADQTSELLKLIHNAKIIANQDNLGFVKAVNMGAAVSSGDFILLLNNDAMLHPGAIEIALDCYRTTADCGAVGGKINLLDGNMQEAGSIIFSDGSTLGYGRNEYPQSPEFMFKREVDYCSGAFLLIELKTFNALGGFDEDYAPAYYEESDFCIRLKKNRLKVIYEPNAVITHYEFASSGGMAGATKLQIAHRKILCNKHAGFLQNQLAAKPENILKARTANNYKNVLLIDDRVPHANLGSGYPRCNELIQVIAATSMNLTLYPLRFPSESWPDTYASVPHVVEVMLDCGTQGLQSFLESRADFYDYIIVSRVHNMEFFVELLQYRPDIAAGATVIYDAEAVTSPREVMRMRLAGESVSPARESKLLEKELALVKHADIAVTVSSYEAGLYHDFGFTNTRVIGHSMVPDPGPGDHGQRHNMLFVGALRDDGSPNVDSLLWFVDEIFPLIRKEIPSIKLLVVGDNSAASLAKINAEGVDFHGRVDDLTAIYHSARIFVAPTRFAAGIPHKVHEAVAQGLPCVTTTLLARQLAWNDAEELLAADLAQQFAEKCIRLYNDASVWNKIRDGGLAAVVKDCSPDQFRQEIASLFE